MKILLQRVNSASVTVDGEVVGEIQKGLLLLLGLGQGDDESKLRSMAEKIANLRIFPDEKGRFHFSALDVQGEVLLVPQFTLFADTSKGRRPEFFSAMPPAEAEPMFQKCIEVFRAQGFKKVAAGIFGAHMLVELENDGPVTIMVEN